MAFIETDPDNYENLLTAKTEAFKAMFADYDLDGLSIYRSPALHFRMRAEFRIWKDGENLNYVMFRASKNRERVIIDDFPIVHHRIYEAMPKLLSSLKPVNILRENLYQVEFLCGLSGELLISLIYHKVLDQDWEDAAAKLRDQLNAQIVGRSRKKKRSVDRDYIIERLRVHGTDYDYMQIDNCFTQPNADVCQHMLEWAVTNSQGNGGDLLELYCGNGNFTLPLSKQFKKVLATEIGKASVRAAEFNVKMNDIDNIVLGRVSSEDFTKALNRERPFFRLKHINLDEYNFSTVFVDPPRAGLDQETLKLISRFDNIIYISCNPQSLAENLIDLSPSHSASNFAIFDQFPYTEHLESGVVLSRKPG